MVFNSDVFLFVFLPLVFAVFWMARSREQRYAVLTISGYVFYGWWDWRFCSLLLLSSVVSFGAALLIESAGTVSAKRAWAASSIAVDLAVLGFFKYYNFFAANLTLLTPGIAPPLLNIVLPIGISFYTFHTISYIADVAAGRVRPTHDILEYLSYVSLFSQLVAGPIVRYRQIEDDLERVDKPLLADYVSVGLGFFIVGLIKKVVVADRIGQYVDAMLAAPAEMSTAGAWSTAVGYALQLYYDFSGYSDMAVGLGHLFGLRIPQNFNAPYRATGIRDFWRRWHISLSTWLRDYLYVPLGGNRRGRLRTDVNVLSTMLLGGLWHGANWTFVLWGAYHGGLLILERHLESWWSGLPLVARRGGTFLLVVVGWVLFRAESLSMAVEWLGKMAGIGDAPGGVPMVFAAWIFVALVAVNIVPETWDMRLGVGLRWTIVYAACFFVAYLFMNERKTVFLYYQF